MGEPKHMNVGAKHMNVGAKHIVPLVITSLLLWAGLIYAVVALMALLA